MQNLIFMLIFFPMIFAVTLPFTSVRVRYLSSTLYVAFLVFLSIKVFFTQGDISASFSHTVHYLLTAADLLLLGYFFYQGMKSKHKLVSILAVVQMVLFLFALQLISLNNSFDLIVDELSRIMLLVVNIVGGIIIIYALQYIQSEEFKECKKGLFIGILFFFIGVMNFLVSTNNIELFFLTFELTTLCSYLLIRYRMDEVAVNNALRALWMNQVGGVAILVALIGSLYYYESFYFDVLLSSISSTHMYILAILALAAFVKGASIPFEKWLLGAMVAPTPVSAILHSATMVKIAPYLILKISPAFSETLSTAVVLFGSFVFAAASLFALKRDYFKEILGLSTIALLALMMAIAAIGSPEATNIVLILIVFHAISKALLFLQAGILEKQLELKYVSDITHLIDRSPVSVGYILIGFASLTLPPFGAFIAKLFSFELIISLIKTNPIFIVSLLCITLGSVLLTLLYFKVAAKLLTPKKLKDTRHNIKIPPLYQISSFLLLMLLFIGIVISLDFKDLSAYMVIIPTILILIIPFLFSRLPLKNVQLAKEYHCGEKDEAQVSVFYFECNPKTKRNITYIAFGLMVFVIIGGVI